jgi:hypothetical protein
MTRLTPLKFHGRNSIQLTVVTDRAAESAASGKSRLVVQVRNGNSSS